MICTHVFRVKIDSCLNVLRFLIFRAYVDNFSTSDICAVHYSTATYEEYDEYNFIDDSIDHFERIKLKPFVFKQYSC